MQKSDALLMGRTQSAEEKNPVSQHCILPEKILQEFRYSHMIETDPKEIAKTDSERKQ